MKFTIDRDALTEVLSRVQGVCSQKSTLAILTSCLLEAHEDGRVSVQGTDLEVSISTHALADVATPGRLALAAKRLADTVKAQPPGAITLESQPNHWADLSNGSIKVRIVGTHPEEFPQLRPPEESLPVQIDADVIVEAIDKTFFSISTDEARASFNGAFMRFNDDGVLQMVSTDGHRLSKIEIPVSGFDTRTVPEGLRKGVIVPRKGLAELRRILKALPKETKIALGVSGDDLLVNAGETSFALRLIPGRFPDFTKVIPAPLEHAAVVSKAALQAALHRASFFTAKSGNTRIKLYDSTLEINAYDPEAGEFNEPMPVQYDGPEVSAGYNYRYLQEVIKVIDADELSLEVINTESPTVIRDVDQENVLFIVMPMQV